MTQLLFSTSDSWLSKAITWFTNSSMAHVDLVLPGDLVIGATRKGVNIRPIEAVLAESTMTLVADVPACDEELSRQAALEQWGKPYDTKALFAFLAREDWAEPDRWFCSELVAHSCAQAGTPLINEDASRVTPRDLLSSTEVYPQWDHPFTKDGKKGTDARIRRLG